MTVNSSIKANWPALSLLFAVLVQTSIGVWWAAGVSHDVSWMKTQVEINLASRLAAADTINTLNIQVQRNSDRNLDQDRRIGDLEGRIHELERRR